ncbi:MAG: hypothetical protein ACRENO_00450 [Thermodesulfobacteriota bacterium]
MPTTIKFSYKSDRYFEFLSDYKKDIKSQLKEFKKKKYLEKFFNFNYFLWSQNPDEITNRLGWLYIHSVMLDAVSDIESFAEEIKNEGYRDILLLGMGGSSLSSDVFKDIFGIKKGFPDLTIVDTTDPDFIYELRKRIDLKKTLIIVSTKSGSTVETLSAMKFFYNEFGGKNAGKHFIGITDPGSKLLKIADDFKFRKIFVNDPNIGGRFSVLSYFGLVPASLMGVDIGKVLKSASSICSGLNHQDADYFDNPALRLGTILGVLSKHGRDKLTFVFSKKLYSFGYWAEQLIAESTGKNGVGIMPVLDQKNFSKEYLSDDRLFIVFTTPDDKKTEKRMCEITGQKQPLIKIVVDDINQLGAEFFRFEFATSVAGSIMGINPFDQPDVESAKIMTKKFLDELGKSANPKKKKYDFEKNELKFCSNISFISFEDLINKIRSGKQSYISIHAYINPDFQNKNKLAKLRDRLEDQSHLPVTLGFGPRFLHSTGQLHKGDKGKGLFIQLVGENNHGVSIPDELGSNNSRISFGLLKKAQAAGDYMALDSKNRPVVTVYLSSDTPGDIQKIIDLF